MPQQLVSQNNKAELSHFYSKDRVPTLLAPNDSEKKYSEQERRKTKKQNRNETKLHCQVFTLLEPL